jgi:hypothetical protein
METNPACFCDRCDCFILPKSKATSVVVDNLDYWKVDDMMTFQNMGFSNTANGKKYLCCADCELGPLGYKHMDDPVCYLAKDKVKYK